MPTGFQPPTPEELNPYFPNFEVTDFVAEGGMGAVFKAIQISLDRPVAIKILPYEMGLDQQFSTSFEIEAKAMAKLNHPNLVQVYDFGNIEGMLYIVMEFVPGRSLFDTAHGKRVAMGEAAQLVSSLCHGLSHAHESGLIHRDIKPANILLDDHARPKIVDFGLARPLDHTHGGGTVYGTRGYTAPEVVHSPNSIDQRADIFSIGVLLYELLTGQLPPHPYVPASSISDSDPEFDTIILKAMHPDRKFRYPDASEMAEELDQICQRLKDAQSPQRHLPTQSPIAPIAIPSLKVKTSSSSPTFAVIAALIALCLALILTLTHESEDEKARTEPPATPEKPKVVHSANPKKSTPPPASTMHDAQKEQASSL